MDTLRYLSLSAVLVVFASLGFAQNSAETKTGDSTQSGEVTKTVEITDSTPVREVLPSSASNSVSVSVPIVGAVAVKPTENPKSTEKYGFHFDRRPRLVVEPSFNFGGNGLEPFSTAVAGGVGFETKHFILESLAGYQKVSKVDEGTGASSKGHIRSLGASAYYRLPKYWFFGTSGGWSQLSTTDSSSQLWNMNFGGGKDLRTKDLSFRLSAAYTPPQFDDQNGLQGVTIQFILPSPLKQGHVMFFEDVFLGHRHELVTGGDRELRIEQTSVGLFTASCSFKMLLRF
jgi:hypothetical protein